jgi:hypothetical protein
LKLHHWGIGSTEKLSNESPTSVLELIHSLVDFIQRAFLANDLENHIVLLACRLDRLAQRFEVDDPAADFWRPSAYLAAFHPASNEVSSPAPRTRDIHSG